MKKKTSDEELFEVFKKASERGEDVRLLRIGGPLEFRRQLMSIMFSTEFQENKATSALLDNKISSISVLIADPDGVPFLNRLDREKAGTWGIWRVRHEILSFAKSLCSLSNLRENPGDLRIAFHLSDLVYNLGIIGQTIVLVRKYEGDKTGHVNPGKSKWLISEKNHDINNYIETWETISRRPDTKWISYNFLNTDTSEPKWPSLYKGNAVLSKKEDLDQEADMTIIPIHVPKVCRHVINHNAEYAWVSINDEQREPLQHLRPVKKAYLGGIVPPFRKRPPVVMEKLEGFSLFQIANEIRTNKQLIEKQEDTSWLLGMILLDSIKALKEFRNTADSVISRGKRAPYQYGKQLKDALNEVRVFIEPICPIFDNVFTEVDQLGEELTSKIEFCPFRDAQLKNRIWVKSTTDESISEMVRRLLKNVHNHSALQSEMKNIRDIDFETSGFNVTRWDDVIHILFFEKSGIFFYEKEGAGEFKHSFDPIQTINSYKDWVGEVDNEKGLWMTVLARSIREFCRRLWYARTMPITYTHRYEHERRGYFLDLALYAAKKLPEYENINKLLGELNKSPEIWPSINNNKYESEIPILPKLPTEIKTSEVSGVMLPKDNQPIYLTREQMEEVEANSRAADQFSRFEQVLFGLKSYVKDIQIDSPECFISYAWGDPEQEYWVERRLATDLQKAGITVVLDQWDNKRIGASMTKFMERVGKTDRVIVVGTPLYKKKYENNEPVGGFVLSVEGEIISSRMFDTEAEKENILPVLLEGDKKSSFPLFLQGRVYADFTKSEAYFDELFKLIMSIYKISPTDPVAIKLKKS